MLKSLNSLLEKLNLKYDDLTSEEKRVYQEWSSVLAQPEVTIADLKKFLPQYIANLEYEQNKYENTPNRDLFYKAMIRNAQMIQAFILGPEKRRQWLEGHIEQTSKNNH